WTITNFPALWRCPVNFNEHPVINLCAESIFDSLNVSAVSIRGELHPACKAFFQVVNEMVCAVCAAIPDKPARNKFRVRVKCQPRPNAARSLSLHFIGNVFVFGINESPCLI